jgi:hypothetical protein
MIPLAATPVGIRPDDYHLPLFVHVLGALALVGALVMAASYLFQARRDGSLQSVRMGFRSLLYAALPAYIVMRVGAGWIADKENLTDSNDAWIGIGFTTADGGLLLIIVSTIAAYLAVRRAGRSDSPGAGTTVAAVIVALLIVAYVVTIWAMTTKPV